MNMGFLLSILPILVLSVFGAAAGYGAARLRRQKPMQAVFWGGAVALLPVVAAAVWTTVATVSGIADNGSVVGLPTCGSRMAAGMVKQGIEGSGTGKAMGIHVLGMGEAVQVGDALGERLCKAPVSLDISSTPRTASYRIRQEGGRALLDVEVE